MRGGKSATQPTPVTTGKIWDFRPIAAAAPCSAAAILPPDATSQRICSNASPFRCPARCARHRRPMAWKLAGPDPAQRLSTATAYRGHAPTANSQVGAANPWNSRSSEERRNLSAHRHAGEVLASRQSVQKTLRSPEDLCRLRPACWARTIGKQLRYFIVGAGHRSALAHPCRPRARVRRSLPHRSAQN